MFISYNNSIVNLDNVTNVLIDDKNKKVIFNMKYSVRLENVFTADYVYWRYEHEDEKELFIEKLISANFIQPNLPTNRWVNPMNVASIKIDEGSLKVIFNLTCSITHPEDVRAIKNGDIDHIDARVTSDYVFIKFDDIQDFDKFVEEQVEPLFK